MEDDPTGAPAGSRGPPARTRPPLLGVLAGFAAAALVGGIVGGLIVRTTWGPGGGNGGADTVLTGANGSTAACPAATVADRALPSVVTVLADNGQQESTGSGVVIRTDGYVLTNDHVISVAARDGTLSITTSGGRGASAVLVGRDPLTDLAVIRAEDASELPPIAIGESGALGVGDPVVALGSPLGLASTVTSGIVSALDRYVQVPSGLGGTAHLVGAIQTDASINPGNSGGALVDCAARLVGINTAGAAIPGSPGGSIGLGFAIPVDLADGLGSELIANGRVDRPSFGMQLQAIPPELAEQLGASAGLFVQGLTPGGPAETAGLQPGDIIVEVEGEPTTTVDDLIVKTLTMEAGDMVRLTYERSGSTRTAVLTLATQGR
jgi:putative serine protease PepD